MHNCRLGAHLASALLQGCNDGVLLGHQALLQGQLRPGCLQLTRLPSSASLTAELQQTSEHLVNSSLRLPCTANARSSSYASWKRL